MADKRISQLIERVDIANNDVLPIVASGATTTNKVTISTIQTWMQDNLDVGVTSVGITIGSTGTDINVTGSPVTSSGNITINIPTASATNRGLLSSANWTTFNNKLSSVGLTMPSAFTVSNSPLTANGTIAVTGAGTVAQYIRGDGSLADFPEGGGGGSAVNYYLNGSVSQGTIGGIGYYEMNKVPVLGAGTDFVAIADGYLASFITDAGDPGLLEIPAGNWNFETYFSASSGGGSPSFYIELYKVNSVGTATLIASNSATPELISFGTSISPYFSPLAVPTTVLTVTDRLAVRYYVARSGRTITMHTENSHLCQIITTFTTGLTALNGLTAQVQNFTTGTSGTDFNISSTSVTHTFNLPDASASNRGAVTTGTQTFAGIKTFNSTITAGAEVQLVQAGTALPTFIKNISGSGLTSSGSNGIGFNNSNNLYVSGSDKGGAVFSINNTGVRTYTFQDNNGTLAFTSDLGGYLPLTGGTLTGAIVGTTSTFTNSGAGIGVGVTNSGSGDGVKITHSAGRAFNIQSSGAGFGVIINNETASTSAPFTIQKQGTTKVAFTDAGAADFSSSVTASSFVKSSGTSSQFLKADGSVDSSTYLTTGTAASTYLPLAGGTLTGALNGTSATMSGRVNINGATDDASKAINVAGNGYSFFGGSVTGLTPNSTGISIGYNRSGANGEATIVYGAPAAGFNFEIASVTSGTITPRLTITNTGAATFSSSVTAGGIITANSDIHQVSTAGLYWGSPSTYVIGVTGNTANGNLSFITGSTVKTTITSTGNVGIGTASPSVLLQVEPATTSDLVTALFTRGASDPNFRAGFANGSGSAANTEHAKVGMWYGTSGSPACHIGFLRDNSAGSQGMTFNVNNSEYLRVTNGGNVGIGTASPAARLEVKQGGSEIPMIIDSSSDSFGAYTQYQVNNSSGWEHGMANAADGYKYLFSYGSFGTANAKVAITSGGQMRVGTSDINSSAISGFVSGFNGIGSKVSNNAFYLFSGLNSSDTTTFFVLGTGDVQNTNNSYGAISDIKLKENVEDATPKLDDLMKVKVRNYNLIGDDKKQIGVIAQELEEVFPAMIDESEDFEEVEVPQVDEEGNEILNEEGEVVTENKRVSKGTTTKSVKYSVFVPMLIKAMQEQQEQIKSLTEQVEALKSQING